MVFISAKSEDYSNARRVAKALQERGIEVFFAPETLPNKGDAQYQSQIHKALEAADHVVVVTSKREHAESPWVEAEWGMFLNEKRSGRKAGNIVTVLCGGLTPGDLPLALRSLQAIPLAHVETELPPFVGAVSVEVHKVWKRRFTRRAFIAGATASILGGAGVGWWFWRQPTPLPAATIDGRLAEWRAFLIARQQSDSNGGFPSSLWVPSLTDAWSSGQALMGLFAAPTPDPATAEAARRTLAYLEKIRVQDEPQGWGYRPGSKKTITEVAAWITLAEIASLYENNVEVLWKPGQREEMAARVERDVKILLARQLRDGSWGPLVPVPESTASLGEQSRTYSIIMVMWVLAACRRVPLVAQRLGDVSSHAQRGALALLQRHTAEKGWSPGMPGDSSGGQKFTAITGQVLYVLSLFGDDLTTVTHNPAYKTAKTSFLKELVDPKRAITDNERVPVPSTHLPFADLLIEGSSFLWYPWSILALATLVGDATLDVTQRKQAHEFVDILFARFSEQIQRLQDKQIETWEMAENLFALTEARRLLSGLKMAF